MPKAFSFVESVFASPFTWGVITLALGAIALAGKFSVRGATGILFLAWLTAMVGICRAEPILHLPWIPRALAISAMASVLGIGVYYLNQWLTGRSPGPVPLEATYDAEQPRVDSLNSLSVELTEVAFGSAEGKTPLGTELNGAVCILLVTVRNTGRPVAVEGFRLSATLPNGVRVFGESQSIGSNLTLTTLSGVRQVFDDADQLGEKTKEPIATGGFVRGRMVYFFSDMHPDQLAAPGTLVELEMRDVLGRAHSAQKEVHGVAIAGPFLHYPGLSPTTRGGSAAPSPPPPTSVEVGHLELRFVYPQSPSVLIVNPTDRVVRDPKYWVGIWNFDSPVWDVESPGPDLSPLPIPVRSADWVQAHGALGPMQLTALPSVQRLVKPGDRLFGCAWVTCPGCDDKTYWFFAVYGREGWYAPSPRTIDYLRVTRNIATIRKEFDAFLSDNIPERERVMIADHP